MKRAFGNALTRLLWGGTTLTPVEHQLLERLVAELPTAIRRIAEQQLDAYNLVQREADGRALNFYRKKGGSPSNMQGLPLLDSKIEEAPLIGLTATLEGLDRPLHAVLTAVHGRIFCMSLSERVPAQAPSASVQVLRVEQSWKSNIRVPRADA